MPDLNREAAGPEQKEQMVDRKLDWGRQGVFRAKQLLGEFLNVELLQDQGRHQEAAEKAHNIRMVAIDGIVDKLEQRVKSLQEVDVHAEDMQDAVDPEKRRERAGYAKAFLRGDRRGNSETAFRAVLAAAAADIEDDAAAERRIRQELAQRYQGEDVSEREIDDTVLSIMKDRGVYVDYLAMKDLQMIAEADKDGRALFDVSSLLWKTEGLTDEQVEQEWEKFNESLAQSLGLDRFIILKRERKEVRQRTLRIESVEQKQEKAAAIEKVSNTLTVARMTDLSGRLNDQQLGVLLSLVDSGAKDLARALLTSVNLGPADSGVGVKGSIEGETVVAVRSGETVDCTLVHGGKRISIDTASAVDSFNEARMTGIAGDIRASSIDKPSEKRSRLLQSLFAVRSGSSFMTGEKADYTEGILGSILKKAGSAAEEKIVMEKLGLITPDGKPNQKMLAWWALEFRLLADQTSPGQLVSATNFEALESLSEKWKQEKKLSLMSLGQLNALPMKNPKETSPETVTT